MIPMLGPLALTASTGVLLGLPLAPALRELLLKHDADPLVTRKDDGRIGNFAIGLRARCEPFRPLLTLCAERSCCESFDRAEGRIFVAGWPGSWQGPQRTDTLVLCAGPVALPDDFQSFEDFYAAADVRSGRNNLFRALLSESSAVLEEGTQVLRWIHAESDLIAGRNSRLYGRASAGRSLFLSPGCTFQRLHALAIYSAGQAKEFPAREKSFAFSRNADASLRRSRVRGRVHLTAGDQHYGDLIASKRMDIDPGACIFGSAKANDEIRLGKNAIVNGSLVGTKGIHIACGCIVKGPIVSEEEIVIGPDVQVGLPGALTTVSAPRIRIAAGSAIYGTVWARIEGRVEE